MTRPASRPEIVARPISTEEAALLNKQAVVIYANDKEAKRASVEDKRKLIEGIIKEAGTILSECRKALS